MAAFLLWGSFGEEPYSPVAHFSAADPSVFIELEDARAIYAKPLALYVTHEGTIHLEALRTPQGSLAMADALLAFASVSRESFGNEAEWQAYWLNVANALTLYGLAVMDPTEPADAEEWRWLRFTPSWSLGAVRLSDLLRDDADGVWATPLHRLALTDGTISGGRLSPEPYDGETLREALNANAEAFMADEQRLIVAYDARTCLVSPWLKELPGIDGDDELLAFVRRYRPFNARELASMRVVFFAESLLPDGAAQP